MKPKQTHTDLEKAALAYAQARAARSLITGAIAAFLSARGGCQVLDPQTDSMESGFGPCYKGWRGAASSSAWCPVCRDYYPLMFAKKEAGIRQAVCLRRLLRLAARHTASPV